MYIYKIIKPNKKIFLLLSTILLLVVGNIFIIVASPKQKFEEGNKEYRFGNYDKAISIYEELVKQGYRSSALFYNLGNSFYKGGNYAKAIVNYERAIKLNPQDDDIQFNLRLARMNTVDKIEPIPKLFYEQWWDRFIGSFSSDTWSKIGIAACWITLLFAGIYIFSNSVFLKKTGFFGGLLFGFSAAFILITGKIQHTHVYDYKTAVIIETSAYIKSSPDEKSTNLFMLHAGTKIEIVDELQGWKKIRIANGNIGWISNNDVEVI